MFSLLSSPSFYLCVSFSLFLFLIIRPIVIIIISSLDHQRKSISDQLESSRCSREEAESFLEDAQNQRRIAKEESERIISNAIDEGKRLSKESYDRLEDFLKMEEKRTESSIVRLENESLTRLQDKVFDISFQFSKQILVNLPSQSKDFRTSLDKEILNKFQNFKL